MSRTDKTSRFRNERERLADVAERVVGVRASGIGLDAADRHLLLSDAAYVDPKRVRSGLRYGNQVACAPRSRCPRVAATGGGRSGTGGIRTTDGRDPTASKAGK